MGSTFRSLEDIVEERSGGFVVLFVQIVISVILMTYVIRRARNELNKTCDEMDPGVQANGHIVNVAPALVQYIAPGAKNSAKDFDVEAQLQDIAISGNKIKKGHQRSKSASAVLTKVSEIAIITQS